MEAKVALLSFRVGEIVPPSGGTILGPVDKNHSALLSALYNVPSCKIVPFESASDKGCLCHRRCIASPTKPRLISVINLERMWREET